MKLFKKCTAVRNRFLFGWRILKKLTTLPQLKEYSFRWLFVLRYQRKDQYSFRPCASLMQGVIVLVFFLKRIQLTATTPTNCAVCLETGSVEFQISNRFQNVSGSSVQSSETAKIFVKTQLDVNLSLGQLIKNVLFEEADPEFQQFAFFKTRIGKFSNYLLIIFSHEVMILAYKIFLEEAGRNVSDQK